MYVLRRLSHLKHRLVGGVVLALCLGAVQVAQASKLPDFSRSGVNYTGKSASVGMTGGATQYGSTVPVSPPLGGGWQFAGNYGIPASATGPTMTMSANGNVFFAGTKYPFQAAYATPVGNVLGGVAAVAAVVGGGGWLGFAAAAAPYFYDWLTRSGGHISETGALERSDPSVCTVSPCYNYLLVVAGYSSGWLSTRAGACSAGIAAYNAAGESNEARNGAVVETSPGTFNCQWDWYRRSDGAYLGHTGANFSTQSVSPSSASWIPSSMDDLRPYMENTSRDGRVVQELLDKGVDFTMPTPTVTGPSSIEGPTKETANPDGSKTVEKTTYNFTTNGNTINNTTNNTTTTVYNTDNSVRTTTDTTNTPDEQPDSLDCQKDSSTIGCSKLDTPEEDLPKADKNVTYTPETWFGGGSCPADKFVTISGQEVKVWDWVESCQLLVTYGRPLILAAAAFMALMILAPGVKT